MTTTPVDCAAHGGPVTMNLRKPLSPIIRFPPPLATLLRWGQDEIPLDGSNVKVYLAPSTESEIAHWQASHGENDSVPLNSDVKRRFAAFHTVSKRYPTPLLALSHALYGDLEAHNGLVDDLRDFFVPPHREGIHNRGKKCKVSLDAVLNALSQSCASLAPLRRETALDVFRRSSTLNRGQEPRSIPVQIDVVVTTSTREAFSVYTCYRGGVLVAPDESHHLITGVDQSVDPLSSSEVRRRVLVILDWHESLGWAPVEYSMMRLAASIEKQKSDVKSCGAALDVDREDGTGLSLSPPSSPDATPRPPKERLGGLSMSRLHSSVTLHAAGSSDAQIQQMIDAKTSSFALPSFEAAVQKGDRLFHPHPSSKVHPHWHGLSAASTSEGVALPPPTATESMNTTTNGPSAETWVSPRPFSALRYPNLDMTDCGVCQLICEPLAHAEVRSTICRFIWTCAFGMLATAVAVALLVTVWSEDHLDSCCSPANGSTCWNTSSSGFQALMNTTASAVEPLCINWMCPANGTLRSEARDAYLYGGWLSLGRLLWLAILGSAVATVSSVLVHHFSVRLMVLQRATAVFIYVAHVAHVVVCTAVAVDVAYAAYLMVLLHDGEGVSLLDHCSWFDAKHQATCLAAVQSQCSTTVSVFLHDSESAVVMALTIALVVATGFHWLGSFVPAVMLLRTAQANDFVAAVPDTEIYAPNMYAPDGATDEDIERMRQALWQSKGKEYDGGQQRHHSFLVSGKQKVLRALQNIKAGIRLAAHRGAEHDHIDGSTADTGKQSNGPVAIHYAVHDSGDLRLPESTKTLRRQMSLTFAPRRDADNFSALSGAVLREIEHISSRVRTDKSSTLPRHDIEASVRMNNSVELRFDPPAASTSVAPQTDKYTHVQNQLNALQEVSSQRNAVIDSIAQRLGHPSQ